MKQFPGCRVDYSDATLLSDIFHAAHRRVPIWLRFTICRCGQGPYQDHNCGATVSDFDDAVKDPDHFGMPPHFGTERLMDVVRWYGEHPAGTALKQYARQHVWKDGSKYRWRSGNANPKTLRDYL